MTYRCSYYLVILTILACMVLNGCGGGAQSSANSGSSSGAGGNAQAPAVTVTPTSYTFSSQGLNSSSMPGTVTLANTGNASLSLSKVSVTGDFTQTNNCGTTLAAGASCTVNVTFTPAATGGRSGTVSFADNAPNSPQVVTLNGTGVAAGQLVDSPSSISFGNVTVGQAASQLVTVKNTGGQSLSVTAISTSGAGIGVSGTSTSFTIGSGQSNTFTVTFTPSSSGSVNGAVYLANNSATPSLAIPVSGTGVAAQSHEVVLSWAASSSSVIGYDTYRGTISGGPYVKLTPSPVAQTSYTDADVTAGSTYYYVVTSMGTDQAESAYSNQAIATVPTP